MLGERTFSFSWKTSLIGLILITGMVRLAFWQWSRYLEKQAYLEELDRRLQNPVIPLTKLLEESGLSSSSPKPSDPSLHVMLHRRVSLSGSFDFSHEMVKRNRKDEQDGPGVHVITPLLIDGLNQYVLVNRGYIPLSIQSQSARASFHEEGTVGFVGLVKLTETPRSFLSPNDPPTGKEKPWVDAWLRVNLEKIQEQLPYPILPFHLELISKVDDPKQLTTKELEDALVTNSNARSEIFYLGDNLNKVSTGELNPNRHYPVPAFSTVVPSATHLLYVFEWGFMALLTLLICVGLQFRKRSHVTTKH